ncbi:MAG TPA: hypothetical protein PLS12_10985 [Bacteroidales bacterium]|nr:hypothetical protein [Bacteroidales bacterium]
MATSKKSKSKKRTSTAKRTVNPVAKKIMSRAQAILKSGGKKTVTKSVYRIKPQVAVKQAARELKQQGKLF